jgi:polygalacturonase
VKIFNPYYSQNGDALDMESCDRALVAGCLIDAGDDGLCIKSGKDQDGRERGEPCSNVVIRSNMVLHGHGGFVVGSEMSGGVNNIYVGDCLFTGTDTGLRFKSTRGRGGVVEDIWIENINMIDIQTDVLTFDLFYTGSSPVEAFNAPLSAGEEDDPIPPVTEETPSFRNIHINNIKCKGAARSMYFNGLPEMRINQVSLENVIITSRTGAVLNNIDDMEMKDVTLIVESGVRVTIINSDRITFNGVEYPEVGEDPVLID